MAAYQPTIQTTQGFIARAGLNMLLYGPPAVGKTPMAKTLSRPLILAAEDGLGSIADANIPYIRLRTKADCENILAWLKIPANTKNFDWIVLDSISNLTENIYTEVVASMPNCKNPMKFYGGMQEIVVTFLQGLLSLDKNVVVIAWQGDEYAPNDGPFLRHIPVTKGKAVATYLMHYFDCTLHMKWHTINQPQPDGSVQTVTMPFLQTSEFNMIFARTRLAGKLAPYEPADLSAIAAKLVK